MSENNGTFGLIFILFLIVAILLIGANAMNTSSLAYYNYDKHGESGWAEYSDNVYNESNRLTIGTTRVNFSMTDYSVRSQEMPFGMNYSEWFNGSHIKTDRPGNVFLYRWRFNVEPQSNDVLCEAFYDIGGSAGSLLMRKLSFSNGQGIEHIETFTNLDYTLDTWYHNGAVMQMECSHDVDFWDIEFTIFKLYEGRSIY